MIFRDGQFTDATPVEEVKVDYPGIGTATAWTVGHPEAVTLPRTGKVLRNSHNVMVGSPRTIDAVRAIAVLGALPFTFVMILQIAAFLRELRGERKGSS